MSRYSVRSVRSVRSFRPKTGLVARWAELDVDGLRVEMRLIGMSATSCQFMRSIRNVTSVGMFCGNMAIASPGEYLIVGGVLRAMKRTSWKWSVGVTRSFTIKVVSNDTEENDSVAGVSKSVPLPAPCAKSMSNENVKTSNQSGPEGISSPTVHNEGC